MRRTLPLAVLWILSLIVPAWSQGWELTGSRFEIVEDKSETPGLWVPGGDGVSMRKAWYNSNADKNFLIVANFSWQGIPQLLQAGQDFTTQVTVEQQGNNETGYDSSIKVYAGLVGGVEADGPYVAAGWREPVCLKRDQATLRAPQGRSGDEYVIRVVCRVAHDYYTSYYTYRFASGGSHTSASAALAGEWAGTWSNSVGESGADTLVLREDASGNLSGTWSGYVEVRGRRLSPTSLELQGSSANRAFTIRGALEGGQLVLRYTARRLDGAGSYDGESRFRRR